MDEKKQNWKASKEANEWKARFERTKDRLWQESLKEKDNGEQSFKRS